MFNLEKFFEKGKVFSVRTSAGIVHLVCWVEEGWEEFTAKFYVDASKPARVSIKSDSPPFCFKAYTESDALLGLCDMLVKSQVGFYVDIELPPRSGQTRTIRFFWNKETGSVDAEICKDEDESCPKSRTAKLVRLHHAG